MLNSVMLELTSVQRKGDLPGFLFLLITHHSGVNLKENITEDMLIIVS